MFLLVADGIPPHVEEAVRPGAAFDEEGTKVETGAILRDDEVDGLSLAVADRAPRFVVKVFAG